MDMTYLAIIYISSFKALFVWFCSQAQLYGIATLSTVLDLFILTQTQNCIRMSLLCSRLASGLGGDQVAGNPGVPVLDYSSKVPLHKSS